MTHLMPIATNNAAPNFEISIELHLHMKIIIVNFNYFFFANVKRQRFCFTFYVGLIEIDVTKCKKFLVR